jgi:uncharacterized membrane protein
MWHDGWRIPDRVFAWLAVVNLLLTWGLLVWAWPVLPDQIPTHFGLTGQPDAWNDKNIFTVFFPALLSTIIGGLFLWLYRSNLSFNIPSRVRLADMPEPEKTVLTRLGRHFLTMMYVMVTLILAYVSLTVVTVALEIDTKLNTLIMLLLVGFLFLITAIYTFWMSKIAKRGSDRLAASTPHDTNQRLTN